MTAIGLRCHELRVVDVDKSWRIIYRLDPDAIVIATVRYMSHRGSGSDRLRDLFAALNAPLKAR